MTQIVGTLLSIVIPHYNSPKSLKKLLNTIPNIEEIQVIVVDDRSNEYIEEYNVLIDEYLHRNIEFYTNTKEAKGAGAARNIGLRYIKGEWTMFADADDYFLEGFYNIVKEYFEQEYDLVYFQPISYILGTNTEAKRHLYYKNLIDEYLESPTLENKLHIMYRWDSPCSKIVRTSVIVDNQLEYDEVMVANDVMCSMKIAYHVKNFQVSKRKIYAITKGDNTLTVILNNNNYNTRYQVNRDRMIYLKERLTIEEFELLDYSISNYFGHMKKYKLPRSEYRKVYKDFKRIGIPYYDSEMRKISWHIDRVKRKLKSIVGK